MARARQIPLERRHAPAGGDGHQQRLRAGELGQSRHHLVHHLRLDRDEDHAGGLRQLVDERQDINAVVGEKIGDGLCRIGILHDHRAGIEAAGEQPREDRSAHLARAGEQQRTLNGE